MNEYINANRPLITAHRGYAEIAPENTLAAFAAAVEMGADATEFDVHRSGDGTLVVIHDETVGRTTNGTGNVAELSDEYLKSLDAGSWKGAQFQGEKIPTLEETLTYLKEHAMVALLEIKTPSIVDDVVTMLYATGMEKRTFIVTFEESAVLEIKEKYPEIPALLLLHPSYMTGTAEEKTTRIMEKAEEMGTKDVGLFAFDRDALEKDPVAMDKIKNNQDPGELALGLDADTIRILHKNGYRIDAWTVDSEENIRALIQSNVDILTSNYLERAIRIKKEVLED
ncbi:MAG: glycerophosphodiester phosphodiesterase family protein [Desulfuromonas sp.]|nr:glycerophosphodiester phosphodiesterase family protein [Desulfuromonas sp.]